MNCELRGTPKFARGTGSLVRIAYADEESQGRGSSGRIGRDAIAFTEQVWYALRLRGWPRIDWRDRGARGESAS